MRRWFASVRTLWVVMQQLRFVRHGEVSNPNHLVYGDLPGFHLSPLGVLQVHSTGQHLGGVSIDIVRS